MLSGKRVVIADDHWATRMGVRAALEIEGCDVVGEAGSATEAVQVALDTKPDLCLFDIWMPGHGIEAARQVTQKLPDTVVVMLTASQEDEDLLDALKAGASGYLLKDMDQDRLPLAIKAVLEGESVLPRSLVVRIADEFHGRKPRADHDGIGASLTEREWETLEMLRRGMKTAEIAERLGVTQVTVRTHVSSILKKLRVPDRQSAIAMFDDEAR